MADEITYTLTEADYVTANRTHFIRSLRSRQTLSAWLIVVIGCGAIGAFVSLGERSLWAKVSVICGLVAWGVITMPLCWLLSFLLLPGRARRLYRQQRALSLPWTYRWTEAGIENEGDTGMSRYQWGDLRAWTRSEQMFLFYVNDILFHMLPTRVLSLAQADNLEALLAEHGPVRR